MIKFSKIYRFLRRRIKENRQRHKQTQTVEQKRQFPARPPTKRILITYGVFSLLFIILAVAAWFLKQAEFLPEHALLQKNPPRTVADPNIALNDEKPIVIQNRQNNKPSANNITDPIAVDRLDNKVKRLKDEIRQLTAELDDIRIRQYLASARYLIDTRTAPERALSILQSARSYIESRPDTRNSDTHELLQDIDYQIEQLQLYIAHSPYKTLVHLKPLIDDMHAELALAFNPSAEAKINTDSTDKAWTSKWLTRIYDLGKNLIKVENPADRYTENNRLLLKLLITARSAVLLNEQQQFSIALQDALRLIDTMSQPPISREQIESILSLDIIWQLPEMQR